MTAVRGRRRRSTRIAVAAVVGAALVAVALTVAGVSTLADSTAGRQAAGQGDDRPTQRPPYTPTAFVGTVDDTGRLTSAVVIAVEPDGTGGSLVQLAASADANSGNSDVLDPLNAVLAVEGPEALALVAEGMTGVSFDVVELIDADRFAQLVGPLGDLAVELPTTLYDTSSGEQWAPGAIVMSGPEAGRALTAVAPAIDDWLFEPARASVWSAVADRVGAGIGSAAPVASDADLPHPTDLDTVFDRLFVAAVQFRQLAVHPVDAERVAEQLPMDLSVAFGVGAKDSVSIHDRSEMVMVMASIAPGRIGAPIDDLSFRVVMGFTEADLDALGLQSSDVLKLAIARLLFAQVNVVSVADLPGTAVPDHTTMSVADEAALDGVRDQYAGAFGDAVDVRLAGSLIDGVDVELVLGRDFLELVRANLPAEVTGSASDDSSGTT